VSEADALAHVAGYCVVNDVSEREYQIERGGTWDKGKGCDTFGPTGPWLVTTDEVGDIRRRSRCGSTSTATATRTAAPKTMIFGVAQIVSYSAAS
jgi:2,4-diketo-3-deoxy-L-fuconate hydrolase